MHRTVSSLSLSLDHQQEESKTRAREEEERRREVADRFQATINDITVKMQEQQQHNQQLKAENIE